MSAFIIPTLPTPSRRARHPCCTHAATRAAPPRAVTPCTPRDSTLHDPAIPPVVFILGGPGSGKGTQCEKLRHDFHLPQVCVGDLLRREAAAATELGRTVAETMQRGDIVPGHVTMRLLRAELATLAGTAPAVLIDGFPRAMDQARDFEDLVAKCCFVLFFQCAEQEMVHRLLKRAETSGRADDNEHVVRRRLDTFVLKTMPVVDYYRDQGLVKEVDSELGDADAVYVHTKRIFEDLLSQ